MRLIKKLRSKYVYKEWPDDEWSSIADYFRIRSQSRYLDFFICEHDVDVPDSLSKALQYYEAYRFLR